MYISLIACAPRHDTSEPSAVTAASPNSAPRPLKSPASISSAYRYTRLAMATWSGTGMGSGLHLAEQHHVGEQRPGATAGAHRDLGALDLVRRALAPHLLHGADCALEQLH